MENIFFTSDTHFMHKNIIRFCDRPFASANEMDEALIENWNSVVDSGSHVYLLGDVSLGDSNRTLEIIKRLNGSIYLITGNHESAVLKSGKCKGRFVWIKEAYTLKVPDEDAEDGKRYIYLHHYACRVWNKSHRGSWHLYGHSHGGLEKIEWGKSMDVGVDCHPEYRPFSYEEVKEILDQRECHDKIEN